MAMREKGFRTLTLPQEIFDYFKLEYERHESELKTQNIRSFSAYMTAVFNVAKDQGYEKLLLPKPQRVAHTQTSK